MKFVALYSGDSLSRARLIALTGDPQAVQAVAGHALKEELLRDSTDPAERAVGEGRRKALRSVIKGSAS